MIKSQQQVVRLLFALGELEQLRHDNDEETDGKDPPEADDNTDNTAKEGLRIKLTIADRRTGDDDVPHAIDHVGVILARLLGDYALE